MLQTYRWKTEYMASPALGVNTITPRFSWSLVSSANGDYQSGYSINVYSTLALAKAGGSGDLWSTGHVTSTQNTFVTYAGTALAARKQAWWTIRAYDSTGTAGQLSPVQSFSIGLLSISDWQSANFLTFVGANGAAANIFRKTFTPSGTVVRATLYITALGLFTPYFNGQKVGTDSVTPHCTDYKHRLYYHTYDVTSLIRTGVNVVGAIVANGYYAGLYDQVDHGTTGMWSGDSGAITSSPALIAVLAIDYSGSTSYIVTDTTWQAFAHPRDTFDPILFAGPTSQMDLEKGESFNSILLPTGWNDGTGLTNFGVVWATPTATTIPSSNFLLQPTVLPATRKKQRRAAISIMNPSKGLYIYDFGQEVTGTTRVKISGSTKGQILTISHGENINVSSATDTSQIFQLTPPLSGTYTVTYNGVTSASLAYNAIPSVVQTALVAIIGAGVVVSVCSGTILYIQIPANIALSTTTMTGNNATCIDAVLYTGSLSWPQLNTYVCKGNPIEIWEPEFVLHGFRYASITSSNPAFTTTPPADLLQQVAIWSDCDIESDFVCSDPTITGASNLAIGSILSNWTWGMTGCANRSERICWDDPGYNGAYNLLYSPPMAIKYILDHYDAQTYFYGNGSIADAVPLPPAGLSIIYYNTGMWRDQVFHGAWRSYILSGDLNVLKTMYPAQGTGLLPAFMTEILTCIVGGGNYLQQSPGPGQQTYGDYASLGTFGNGQHMSDTMWAMTAWIAWQSAVLLGYSTDAATYSTLYTNIVTSYRSTYGSAYGATQSDWVQALVVNNEVGGTLIPSGSIPGIVTALGANIAACSTTFQGGYIGQQYWWRALGQNPSLISYMYTFLQRTAAQYPSFAFLLSKNVTCMTESWQVVPQTGLLSVGTGGNSLNHPSYATVYEGLVRYIGGLDYSETIANAGQKALVFYPHVGNLTRAKVERETPYGRAISDWSIYNGGVYYTVTIPPGSTATVYVPTSVPSSIRESGGLISSNSHLATIGSPPTGYAGVTAQSGTYYFTATQ